MSNAEWGEAGPEETYESLQVMAQRFAEVTGVKATHMRMGNHGDWTPLEQVDVEGLARLMDVGGGMAAPLAFEFKGEKVEDQAVVGTVEDGELVNEYGHTRKPSRGPGGKLRRWERKAISARWYVAKRGQRVDVVRSAQTSADNTGADQIVHAHRKDEPCTGVRWPREDGSSPDGTCIALRPRPRVAEATGALRRATAPAPGQQP